jgi:hypothetical protein
VQWKTTLETYAAPLRAKPVDSIATDDVLAVLKPIWTKKGETASRLRGRIEKVLDAAKAKGFRNGDNPARWRGHLDHLLPKPPKLARGHHPALPYEDVAAFVGKLREREATAALALEFCILMAARSGEVLGARWSEIDLDKKNLDGARQPNESRSRSKFLGTSFFPKPPRAMRTAAIRSHRRFALPAVGLTEHDKKPRPIRPPKRPPLPPRLFKLGHRPFPADLAA